MYHSEIAEDVAGMLLGVLEWCKNLCPAWLTDWTEYVLAMPVVGKLADVAEKAVQWGAVPIFLVHRLVSWFHPVMVMKILKTLVIGSKPFQWVKRIGSKPYQWVNGSAASHPSGSRSG